ncbi:MAG: hypothetical protein V3V26_00985, partial [Candidatus Aenigmarchaeota archaeon]
MHKKYIKKKGRKFGPYFYTTIRDRNGIAKSYYLSQDREEALRKEEELKARVFKERERTFPIIPQRVYAAAFLIVACLSLFLGANFTGLLVSGETIQYSQELGVGFTQSTNHTISLQAHSQQFYMNSLMLSGKVIGNGTAKVYIESPTGERRLVLDHSPPREGFSLTGMMTAAGNGIIEEENATAQEETNATVPENTTIPEEELNITVPEENITTNVTEEVPEMNVTEPVNETLPEYLNITIPEENVTANITEPLNETLNITLPEENMTANITEENVTNITLPEEGINVTIPEENVTNVTLPEENVTLPEENVTANITEENVTTNVTEEVPAEIPV